MPSHEWIGKIRPAPLAQLVGSVLGVRRQLMTAESGLRFMADPISHFGRELRQTGTYEAELSAVMQDILGPGHVLLDVGANEGYFSVLASARVKPFGKVFAVEPQSRLQACIRENLALNACDNVELVRLALSNDDAGVTLNLASIVNSGASSIHRRQFWTRAERVPSATLDDFVRSRALERIRLIKLDCEGAELPILEGAARTLASHAADFLSVDYHPAIVGANAVRRIDGLLRTHGYVLTETGTGPWLYHLPHLDGDLARLGPLRRVSQV